MRIHLLTNGMLTGQSLQMCQDYGRPYYPYIPFDFSLEWHIQQICHRYDVTFEELFSSLMKVKAYDSSIRCRHCGRMYELYKPCNLPNSNNFITWECQECQNFKKRGVVRLNDFLNSLNMLSDDECPF